MIQRRKTLSAFAAGSLLLLPGLGAQAHAETYPSKTVTIIVPFAAGGTVDKVARTVREGFQSRLGQAVIIDNRGGAGGTIGSALLTKSAPDGYTGGMVFDSFATEQHIYPKLRYSERDLTGVAYIARSPMVLVVPASSPFKTLQDYVSAAKKKPNTISYASVGSGSSNHLAAELFHQSVGTSGLHTPYKGGGPAITDLLGAHVDSMIASLPLVLGHVESGKLRALAVTSAQRAPRLPEVPAIAESYKDFEVYSWVGMVAPARTPAAILDRLASDMQATLRDAKVAKQLGESGFEVVAGGRDAMNRLVKSESDRWGRIIKSRHIVAE
ncbi:tripartite tricarboxylate transporter substrate binding protein [Massilia niastensis]|uniref:tripartite tricarboxylate transporter substrate binding protein n=1 Tax=Massilia niastensis TaxID=544911 RepID=UPI0003758946